MLRLIDAYNERAQEQSLPLLSYGVIATIVDWIDIDDDVTVLTSVNGDNQGAESDYYRKLEPAYLCKNTPLDSLDELLLVKGVTEDWLYGELDLETGKRAGGLASCLTVYGDSTVELNSASELMIQSLSEAIDPLLAREVVNHRPYRNAEQLRAVPGMTQPAYQALSACLTGSRASQQYYRVRVSAQVGQIGRRLGAVVKKDRRTGSTEIVMQWPIN